MDSVTQALLGAAVGEACLGNKIGNKALILGGIVGTIPDLDVLLTPFFSDIAKITVHRGYSHSILFCLIASLALALLLRNRTWTKGIVYFKIWQLTFLGLFTHVLLDSFTTYGTQLFLPFNNWRVGFDSINIVDPFYTVPLLIGVVLSVILRKKYLEKTNWVNSIGLIISSLYLVFTLANKENIEQTFREQLKSNDINYQDLLTVPVGIGNHAWYGVAKDESSLHIGKYDQFKKNNVSFETFPINEALLSQADSSIVETMKWFSKDFYVVAESSDTLRFYNMQCDMQGTRYYGDYKAPTAFYFQIWKNGNGETELTTGMHPINNN